MEAADLEQVVRGSVTDAVAGWLAAHYAHAAREQLAGLEGGGRLKLLRTFAHDWALLRKGDQTAERLRIDRQRLAKEEQDSLGKWKRKTIVGLEALLAYAKHHPKAQAALDALAEEVSHPFDPSEQVPKWDGVRHGQDREESEP
jgi:hypothetical protein